MVATGAAALDVRDDVLARHLGGDVDDRLDLVDGSWLEHDVADADAVELIDQVDGFFEVGNARRHDDAVDRGARLAGPLHQTAAAHLKLPHVRVQEQRVELRGPTGLQQLGQLGDAVREDLLGDLAATGQLGPVARVGGGGGRVSRRGGVGGGGGGR